MFKLASTQLWATWATNTGHTPDTTNIFNAFNPSPGFNSLVGAILGFSILVSAEVFKHHPDVWFLDGTFGILIGLIIFAYGAK